MSHTAPSHALRHLDEAVKQAQMAAAAARIWDMADDDGIPVELRQRAAEARTHCRRAVEQLAAASVVLHEELKAVAERDEQRAAQTAEPVTLM